ncbi:PLP-dependent aminotransferase family protein [Streptomyces sp. ISL-100]|uniref:aminotransferase-like domain-containing protein n=1 Tax=Streptomyces sp. ISL-100 TaxID=2819173 RepID=UPI001BEAC3CA|nr:PLP-dependent aminotransferase family protein [Streptomyces sp. ISL-100]MBT2394802.1 PLP-dependent aminotransferase family protein [Streptomyces sp. ISL-100]
MAEDFRRVADQVAAEIAAGRLRPGDRLPTQRAFARSRRIANSTAIRVYGELVRRGLAVGEVGRGTFVRAAPPSPGHALTEEGAAAAGSPAVNLELNYPVTEGQSELMAQSLAGLLRPDVLEAATRPAAADGTPAAREAAASLLARGGWRPDAGQLLFAGNGRQAIAAAIASFVRPGGRLGVEALTYPLVKAVAERLGVSLVPITGNADGPVDASGLCPDALYAVHRSAPLGAVYVQPTLHNPTSVTMSEERRSQLAAACAELNIGVVEDTTWAFLAPEAPAPLAAHAPARTVLVDSLSKRLAPGLTTGFLAAPTTHTAVLADALRSGAWTAARFNLEAATRWIADGTVATVTAAKRADTAARHRLVRRRLGGFRIVTDPRAYYCWWKLPAPWRTDTFVAAAAARGVAITPGSAFAVPPHTAPDAVRIGLASPAPEVLSYALETLAELARRPAGG